MVTLKKLQFAPERGEKRLNLPGLLKSLLADAYIYGLLFTANGSSIKKLLSLSFFIALASQTYVNVPLPFEGEKKERKLWQ